ncbi:uncharacterized protein LOC130719534 [Lotus japonicus]|uniref:uncharacterized protein LOC130719534 n=1 Tax=Lotus japonicus TaxID=34305 RepID=UPI00258A22C3|nr:uncharacterized protein LOC130719534 [Lotus japonicus]
MAKFLPMCVDQDISDHCPLLLRNVVQNWGSKPFRVLNCWFQNPVFRKFVVDHWSGLQVDIQRAVEDLWANRAWPKGSNVSFIVLVPKVTSPQELHEFRPISLIGYKIVAKILAKRLKGVLPKIIDETLSAFLGGRNMLDGVVVSNEVAHATKYGKEPTILLKVDFEKAYDTVDSSFLNYMMRRTNFCEKLIKWINSCLSSASVFVLDFLFVGLKINSTRVLTLLQKSGLVKAKAFSSFRILCLAWRGCFSLTPWEPW